LLILSDRPIVLFFLVLGLLLCIVPGFFCIYLAPPRASIPVVQTIPPVSSAPAPLVQEVLPSFLSIAVDAPSSMLINHSYVVKASLGPEWQSSLALMREPATVTASGINVSGTPDAAIKDAFGPGYTPIANATLSPDAGPFQIVPIAAEPPSGATLDQQSVVWKWSVIPRTAGASYLDVTVTIIWKSLLGKADKGPYMVGDQQPNVQVLDPTPVPPKPTPVPPVTVDPVHINIPSIANALLPYILGIAGSGSVLAVVISWTRKKAKSSSPSPETKGEQSSSGSENASKPLAAKKRKRHRS
jgi:hypothetical protein